MLSSIDFPAQIVESPWQDKSSYEFHPMDSEVQTQHSQESVTVNDEAQIQAHDPFSASQVSSLVDLHMHFQDLQTFIHHPDFDHFAHCWMESQYYICLSKHVEYRSTAMAWFASSSVQLSFIASNYPSSVPDEDAEASTPHIKAAYQRLGHLFNVMHKLIETIENGRVHHRSPQEVMLPIFNQLLATSFDQPHPHIDDPLHHLAYDSPHQAVPMSLPPSLHHSDASSPLEFPPDHQHLLPHEYLSNPATPNATDALPTLFWAHPDHLDQLSFGILSPSPASTIKDEEDEFMSTITPKQLEYNHQDHIMQDSATEDQDSEYHLSFTEDEDDDYEEDSMDDTLPTSPKKKTTKRQHVSSNNKSVTTRHSIPRRGRTATSYDDDTTHFLKTMFFNIYSQRDKLTKDQRRQVVEKTGLKPRNITYWFSNHKRRFQAALDVFKKLVAESNGRIQTYDDFIQWRRENGLPEDITDNRT